jgi:hypothetical protein
MDVPLTIVYSVVAGLLAAGVSYGGLLMKSRTNSLRIEQVKKDHDADIAEIRELISDLSEAQSEHRTETTDRLARIETKLDHLLGGRF